LERVSLPHPQRERVKSLKGRVDKIIMVTRVNVSFRTKDEFSRLIRERGRGGCFISGKRGKNGGGGEEKKEVKWPPAFFKMLVLQGEEKNRLYVLGKRYYRG